MILPGRPDDNVLLLLAGVQRQHFVIDFVYLLAGVETAQTDQSYQRPH